MKQLLERKHGTRAIVLALLLTMLAWLAPMDWQIAKAADGEVEIPVNEGNLLFDKTTRTITGYKGEVANVTIPQQTSDGIAVTAIGDGAFAGCHSLTSITIPNSVTAVGEEAFASCSSLTSVTIPNSVTAIGDSAFYGCSSLTSITIPNSITSIGFGAFQDCSSLTSVTIPNSVTAIGDVAFSYCDSLTSITIPNTVTTIGEKTFTGCLTLSTITVGGDNQNYSSDQQGVLFDKGKTRLIQYPAGRNASSYEIPNTVTTIGDLAFDSCDSLASVTIPNSVTTIGNSAFWRCSSLASVTIPNSVTKIDNYAFWCCSGLTSATIPGNVTAIGDEAFYGCNRLASVVISNSVTTIGEEAFGYYLSDERDSVKVPNFKIYGYSNSSAAAKYAKNNGFAYAIVGSEGTDPNNDAGNKGENAQDSNGNNQGDKGDNAQGNNGNDQGDKDGNPGDETDNDQGNVTTSPTKSTPATAPTQAKPGTTVKDKESNGSYVVTQAKQNGGTATYKKPLDKKKTSVTIPATVEIGGETYKVTAIEKNAFKGNKRLKSVKIGANVEEIRVSAFNKCTKLKTVKIPKKVKTIQKMAFANCKNLKSITIQTKKLTKKTVGAKAFKGINKKAIVKTPKGKAKVYAKLLRFKGLGKGAKVK